MITLFAVVAAFTTISLESSEMSSSNYVCMIMRQRERERERERETEVNTEERTISCSNLW